MTMPRPPYRGAGKDTTVEVTATDAAPVEAPARPSPRRRTGDQISTPRAGAKPVASRPAAGQPPAAAQRPTPGESGPRRSGTHQALPRRRRRRSSSGLLLLGITIVLAIIAFLIWGESGFTFNLGTVSNSG